MSFYPLVLGAVTSRGLPSRRLTDAVVIVVSESSMVRVFDDGRLIAEIIPELWLLSHHDVQLRGPYREERQGDIAVLVTDQRTS